MNTARHRCGWCRGKLVEINATATKDIKSGNIVRTPKKRAPPSAYNLFVKENSKIVRERMMKDQKLRGLRDPKVSQSEIMKECARLWREKKATA